MYTVYIWFWPTLQIIYIVGMQERAGFSIIFLKSGVRDEYVRYGIKNVKALVVLVTSLCITLRHCSVHNSYQRPFIAFKFYYRLCPGGQLGKTALGRYNKNLGWLNTFTGVHSGSPMLAFHGALGALGAAPAIAKAAAGVIGTAC
jgi:hypothetical protein